MANEREERDREGRSKGGNGISPFNYMYNITCRGYVASFMFKFDM